MSGDVALGTVIRQLRSTRKLTLAVVARRVGCDESLLSLVETGRRTMQQSLAEKLDEIYGSGTVITSLLRSHAPMSGERAQLGVSPQDTLHVQVPGGGEPMLVSRRHLLAALGVGLLADPAALTFEHAVAQIEPTPELLKTYTSAFDNYQVAGRTMTPTRLIDAMIGHVAVLGMLRRRTEGTLRRDYLALQARYAESLSWLNEEAGRDADALYWTDRASEWAQTGGWTAMMSYTFVRRSMLAITFTSDGATAVDYATTALDIPRAPARIRGLAAKQAAFGYALTLDPDRSTRALDTAMDLLSAADDDGSELGQRSVPGDDLYRIFQSTCAIYLGKGEQAIDILQPRLDALSTSSARTAAITTAKLSHAYANAGQPHEAAQLALRALEQSERLESRSALNEVRRAGLVLRQWHRRSDVAEVLHRLRSGRATPA